MSGLFVHCLSISVKLNANRVVIGTLRGFDQFMNLVVDNTMEVNGNDKTDIGMVVSFFLLLKAISNLFHVYFNAVRIRMLRKIQFSQVLPSAHIIF